MDLHLGDCLAVLRTMDSESVNCCVTSPPYWGLRDYCVDGQLGLEKTPEEYVARMVAIFAEVRRVLRDDGTCWVNLGDSYTSGNRPEQVRDTTINKGGRVVQSRPQTPIGLKPKDLVGIPCRVAFALQSDGWYLRQDIIWHKPNPMPESVRDRCTKSHEYIFLLTKSARYWYDADSIKEAAIHAGRILDYTGDQKNNKTDAVMQATRPKGRMITVADGRNKRSVWTVATKPFPGAHFAVFPSQLIDPCIKAGCPEGGLVLDPFTGSGTTGMVAVRNDRRFVGIELNAEYLAMARRRIELAALEPKQDELPGMTT